MQVMLDSSGAPALVIDGGRKFAVDCVGGQVRPLRVVSRQCNERRASQATIRRVCAAYERELRYHLGERFNAWMLANIAMYAEVQS